MGRLGFVLFQRLLWVALLTGLALGACASDDECNDELVDGVCQKRCDDTLCTNGAHCVNNACSAPCTTQTDCAARRYCVGVQLDEKTAGKFCVCLGAVVDGECRQKECDEAACPKDWRCLENACSAPCKSHADCPLGTSCLLAAFTDADGGVTQGTYCAPSGSGQDTPCTGDSECDQARGWRCVTGRCRVACATHRDCGAVGSCTGAGQDGAGNPLRWCEPDDKPRGKGQYGTPCPSGNECDEPGGFACYGTGAGDLDAYCTRGGCASDADCPLGLECDLTRSGRPPCQDACGLAGVPGNQRCVPADQIGPGREFSCGPLSLVRNLCVVREFCSECETAADCMGKPNQVCARDIGGKKICTVLCDPDINSCPWGNAGVCDVWDSELGVPTCAHRFGSCRGTGKSCEPCIDESDCGSNGLCISSNFTHERYCIDLGAGCDACTDDSTCTGNGCPLTPGGLAMTCYGGIDSREPLYRKCVGANVNENPLVSPQGGCWPAQ